MSLRERLRAFCIGCMVGTACSWTVFSTLILALPDSDPMYRLWLNLVSAVLGGAVAGCISGSVRSLASLVISCCMTLQLYNPAFGPSAIPPTEAYARLQGISVSSKNQMSSTLDVASDVM